MIKSLLLVSLCLATVFAQGPPPGCAPKQCRDWTQAPAGTPPPPAATPFCIACVNGGTYSYYNCLANSCCGNGQVDTNFPNVEQCDSTDPNAGCITKTGLCQCNVTAAFQPYFPPRTSCQLCTQMFPIRTAQLGPSVVKVTFSALNCNGNSIPTSTNLQSFQLTEDGKPLSTYEGSAAFRFISNQPAQNRPSYTQYQLYTLLLVDISASVDGNETFVSDLVRHYTQSANDKNHYISIRYFDGNPGTSLLQDFTNDANTLNAASKRIQSLTPSDPSTNLNGAVADAVRVLAQKTASQPLYPQSGGELIIISDGSDQAQWITQAQALAVIAANPTVGINAVVVSPYGSTETTPAALNAFVTASYAGLVVPAGVSAQAASNTLISVYKNYANATKKSFDNLYEIVVCSPKRNNTHNLGIALGSGNFAVAFCASGFHAGCSSKMSDYLTQDGTLAQACAVPGAVSGAARLAPHWPLFAAALFALHRLFARCF